MTGIEPAVSLGPRPLGLWSTAGWVFVALLVSFAATVIVVVIAGLAFAKALGIRSPKEILVYTATIPLYVFFFLVIAWRVKRSGWRFVDYVALAWPKRRDVLVGMASMT